MRQRNEIDVFEKNRGQLSAASRDLLVAASTSGDVITSVVAADGDGRVATCRTVHELPLRYVAVDSLT